jgi:hypothetical protein
MRPGMLEKLGEGGMRGKFGAKKWQWRLLSLNEETLAWYAETSAGGGAGGTAEDAMTEMVRPWNLSIRSGSSHICFRTAVSFRRFGFLFTCLGGSWPWLTSHFQCIFDTAGGKHCNQGH